MLISLNTPNPEFLPQLSLFLLLFSSTNSVTRSISRSIYISEKLLLGYYILIISVLH